jgi:hypothetical protein
MLPTKRSAIALALRRPHWCLDDADADRGEDGVERGGEFGVAVPDQEPELAPGVVEAHDQVAGLLGQPGAGGVGGDAEDVHAAGGVLDDEERVQPPQGDGLNMEQVAGQDRVRLRAEELTPRRSGPARCGIDPGCMEDRPDRRGADLVAEAGELAVDAVVPPCRILGSQAEDQGAQASGDGRSTGPDGLSGPAAGDELAVPAQDGGRRDHQPEVSAGGGSSRMRAAIRARSVQLIRGRGIRRWSTASWWRRTRISMSLVVSDRVHSTIQPKSLVNIW